ncbi:NYN domain-containing protein [Emticicia sp. BO119]|uniref:LabA-like NYN domain-containing protein n=1 Tax=Emticicia sp. BO119 TaxID=2757768 RepID=UPI0015F0C488|nr:NYN domain-containing protein [Emticicia sp. BO119]MBA4850475.1 NYN domain-containing protein [Emticicia sp. BO119]
MQETPINYAFIDSQNLYLAVKSLGWTIDWSKFRVYLKQKYHVEKAYLFIGYIENNNRLYEELQDAGFICIWKPVLKYKDGTVKGNCDAELVLQTMIQINNFDKAVIVTGDGDFYCLVDYLISQNKLSGLLIPNKAKYSGLLKFKIFKPFIRFMNDLELKIKKTS